MKRLSALALALAALLRGCASRQVWERVSDPLADPEERVCSVMFTLPDGASEEAISGTQARRVYTDPACGYEIVAERMETPSLEAAVKRLTGFSFDALHPLKTTKCGLPEYRFAWYASGDEGGRLYRADVLKDEGYCYALVFSVPEGSGTAYDSTAEAVFASMSLFYEESGKKIDGA